MDSTKTQQEHRREYMRNYYRNPTEEQKERRKEYAKNYYANHKDYFVENKRKSRINKRGYKIVKVPIEPENKNDNPE